MPATSQEILTAIFADPAHPLAAPFSAWLGAAPRFRAFAETYQRKIHKKVRAARDHQTTRDLWAELATAELLLRERQLTLAYEQDGVGTTRAPDFHMTWRTHTPLAVEVTRMRGPTHAGAAQAAADIPGVAAVPPVQPPGAHRLAELIGGKLGQLLPGMGNVLLIYADGGQLEPAAIDQAARLLRERAERKEPGFFARYNLQDASDFFKQYQRLSAIAVRTIHPGYQASFAALWTNNQARHALPAALRTALSR